MIEKIISGGQTGADRGGLEAGCLLGLPTGGWRTEAGSMPDLGRLYGLREHVLAAYPPRALLNVTDSDGTLVDIEHTDNITDEVCRRTLRRVIEQLDEVERIIERS